MRILKGLLVSLLFAALVLPLSASGGQDTAKEDEQTVITYWYAGTNAGRTQYFNEAAAEFEAATGIKVELTNVPGNPSEIETKLNAAQLSGTFPDVFGAYLVFMGTRGSRGDFAELDGYINAWDGKDDLYESALEMGKYQGKIVGLGYAPAPEILVYRKDYFAESGLDPESPPTSYNELTSYAEKLTVRDAQGNVTRAGFDIPAVTPALVFLEPFMRSHGSLVIDEQNGVPSFTDPGAVKALEYLVDLKNRNISIPFNAQKGDEIPFVSGRAAMSIIHPNSIKNMINNDPSLADKIGYAPVLGEEKHVAFCGYRLFAMGADSKHKGEAWQFIEFMMSPEQMWKRYELVRYPIVRKSLTDRFVHEDPAMNEAISAYVQHGKGKAVVPWTSLANKYLSVAYEEAMNNQKSAEQALLDAEDLLQKELR